MNRWGVMGVVGTLWLALGCVGPTPACVDDGTGQAFVSGACGPFDGENPNVSFDRATSPTQMAFATCAETWSARCWPSGEYELDEHRGAVCFERGGTPFAVGESPLCVGPGYSEILDTPPRCVVIPCDGNTYYGPAHPGAP
jgi:hypothetical protein